MKVNITLLPVPKKYGMMESPQIDMAQLFWDLEQIPNADISLYDGRNLFSQDDVHLENLFDDMPSYESYFHSIYDSSILENNQAKNFYNYVQDIIWKQDIYIIPFSVLEQFRIEYIVPALCFIKFLNKHFPDAKIILFWNYSYKYAKVFQEKFSFVDAIVLHADNISLKNYLLSGETKNIIYRDEKWNFQEGKQDYGVNIDEFMPPNFDHFNLNFYSRKWKLVLPYELSRGCKNSCFFCYYIHKGGTVYKKDSGKICRDLIALRKKYKTNLFHFHDAEVNADNDFLMDVCKEMIATKTSIFWSALAIPHNLDINMLKLLYTAGCRQLRFWVESGSPKILKVIGKGTNVEEIENILRDCKRVGISTYLTLITDIPQEDFSDVTATTNFLIKNKDYIWDLQMCRYGELGNFPVEHLKHTTFPKTFDRMSPRKMLFETLQRKLWIPKWDIVEFIRNF